MNILTKCKLIAKEEKNDGPIPLKLPQQGDPYWLIECWEEEKIKQFCLIYLQ